MKQKHFEFLTLFGLPAPFAQSQTPSQSAFLTQRSFLFLNSQASALLHLRLFEMSAQLCGVGHNSKLEGGALA